MTICATYEVSTYSPPFFEPPASSEIRDYLINTYGEQGACDLLEAIEDLVLTHMATEIPG